MNVCSVCGLHVRRRQKRQQDRQDESHGVSSGLIQRVVLAAATRTRACKTPFAAAVNVLPRYGVRHRLVSPNHVAELVGWFAGVSTLARRCGRLRTE
jgi:hypothetical protein